MADPFVLSHVRRLPLFAQLNPEQLDVMAGAFQQIHYRAGEALYHQGEDSHALYLFVSGGGQILTVDANGAQHPQSSVAPGEYVGESSLFTGNPRDMTVVATAESIVLCLPKPRLDVILSARPDIRALLNVRKDLMENVQVQQARGVRSDEAVLFTTRRHPWTFAGKALRGVILFTLLLALAIFSLRLPLDVRFVSVGLFGLALVLPTLLSLVWFFDWRNDFYTITNQRVIHEERHLLTGREEREQVLLDRLQNVNIERRGYIPELVGFGDLTLTTAGQPKPLVLDRIPNPAGVQRLIFDQLLNRPISDPAANQAAIRSQVNGLIGASDGGATMAAPSPIMPSVGNIPPTYQSTTGGLIPRMRTVDGTRIIYRKYWFVLIGHLWKPIFAYGLLVLLIVVRLFVRSPLVASVSPLGALLIAAAWLVINTFWLVWEYLSWYEDVYIIDDDTITDITRTPFGLRESRMQASLQQIQNVTSAIRNLWGSLFNYGDVTIQTAAGNAQIVFKGVYKPNAVAEEILQRVRQYELRRAASQQSSQQRAFGNILSAYHQATRADGNLPPDPTHPQR